MAKEKRDWTGDILLLAAVGVGAPRWAGAMLAADVGVIDAKLSNALHVLNLISGMAMGVLEAVAIYYMLGALRGTKPKTTKGKVNWRWWGIVVFSLGSLALTPFILAPYIQARMQNFGMTGVLSTAETLNRWSIAVTLAPVFIVGGVAFARGIKKPTETKKRSTRSAAQAAPRKKYACGGCDERYVKQQSLAAHYRHFPEHKK